MLHTILLIVYYIALLYYATYYPTKSSTVFSVQSMFVLY